MRHELKIWPQYFCRVEDGSKTFEVRENDRGFQPGDEVVLKEYNPNSLNTENWANPSYGKYSGRELSFRIGYLLPIDEKRVVFSLLPIETK